MKTLLCFIWTLGFSAAWVYAAVPAPISKEDKAKFDVWAAIRKPAPGAANPVGSYDAGCLYGAVKLAIDGKGYAFMRLSRRRNFGHPDMDAYLHALGEKLAALKSPLLLIGDVGPARGGPMLSGHASHQIGLDADLWLRMSKKRPSRRDREKMNAPSFVVGRKKLKAQWGKIQVTLVTTAADSPSVARIFVSPAIKRYFCDHFASAPWLYKLRPWWGHEEHIHVRLNCPEGASSCQSQTALNPADNGCGKDLDWWFSKEADDEWTKMENEPKPRTFPELPAACAQMP